MKLKWIIAGIVLLVISLFANLVLSLNLSNTLKENNSLATDITPLESQSETVDDQVEEQLLYENEGQTEQIIESFFRVQYEYTDQNYKERFSNIKEFVNEDVYGQLTSAGTPDIPSVEFENKINDLQIYITQKDNQTDTLVLLDTSYNIEGFTNSNLTQIFNISFDDSENVISSLNLVGTFTKMNES